MRQCAGAHGPALHAALGDARDEWIKPAGWVCGKLHVECRRGVGKIFSSAYLRTQAVDAGGDGHRFQQRPQRDLAGPAVQIVNNMVAGIESVHDQVEPIDDLEAPGLGVVPTGCPACQVKDLLHDTIINHAATLSAAI